LQRAGNPRWRCFLFVGLAFAAILIAAQLTHHFDPKWLPIDSSSILALTGFIVGLVALIIAIKTDDTVAKALIGIETWAKAMPTRHVGPFPGHLKEICALVRDTNNGGTLDIIADCADYGSFYAPELYKELQSAMSDAKSKNVRIRYLACGGLHRFTANSPYFEKEKSDLNGTGSAEFREKLRRYLDVVSNDVLFRDRLGECFEHKAQRDFLIKWLTENAAPQKEQVNWDAECRLHLQFICDLDFSQPVMKLFDSDRKLDFLLFVREWFNEGVLRNVATVKRDPRMAPLFMWLRDAETTAEAVFVLPSPYTGGFGFRTLDSVLILSLSSTFKRYWEDPLTNKNTQIPRHAVEQPTHA